MVDRTSVCGAAGGQENEKVGVYVFAERLQGSAGGRLVEWDGSGGDVAVELCSAFEFVHCRETRWKVRPDHPGVELENCRLRHWVALDRCREMLIHDFTTEQRPIAKSIVNFDEIGQVQTLES